MSKSTLLVFAQITPKPEYFTQAKEALIGILQPTRSEAGCMQFHLNQGSEAACLYLYEEWEDDAALAKHYEQPYVTTVFESYKEWLAEPVRIEKMTSIA